MSIYSGSGGGKMSSSSTSSVRGDTPYLVSLGFLSPTNSKISFEFKV
jgi:hypothetical protein